MAPLARGQWWPNDARKSRAAECPMFCRGGRLRVTCGVMIVVERLFGHRLAKVMMLLSSGRNGTRSRTLSRGLYSRSSVVGVMLAAGVVLAAALGCSQPIGSFPDNAVFVKRMEIETGTELTSAQGDVAAALEIAFGTPDQPTWPSAQAIEQMLDANDAVQDVNAPAADAATSLVSMPRLQQAAGAVSSLEDGKNLGLYRKHCISCHGVSGNGAGPAAKLLSPYPRDFRLGKFKFKSTPIGTKPTLDDLRRTLVHGIPGTAMPAFSSLPDSELDALIDYVIYLTVRGETERAWLREGALEVEYDDGERLLDPALATAEPDAYRQQWDVLLEFVDRAESGWHRAAELAAAELAVDKPGETIDGIEGTDAEAEQPGETIEDNRSTLASIARGKELFMGDVASCAKCHGVLGVGDGLDQDYDDWTKDWSVMAGLQPTDKEQLRPMLKLGALPPRTISPRNLRSGVLRGGSRPIDVYWRIVNGIEGTPMPAVARQPDNPLGLSEQDVWDLVNYVLSLPEEAISGEDLQQAGSLTPERQAGHRLEAYATAGLRLEAYATGSLCYDGGGL